MDKPNTTPLPYLAAVRFSGADAGRFLHDQVSADVLALADGQATLACYCEPKGRVLALLHICRSGQDYIAVMARELAADIVARLKVYVFRARVRIELSADQVAVAAADERGDASALPIPLASWPGMPSGSLVLRPRSAAAAPARTKAWRFAELRRGISWLGNASSGQFLPQMLGFDAIGAVNYKKGCYPGQEIVARTHYLGKVKRHPRVLVSRDSIHLKPMEKITLQGAGEDHEAVVVDSAPGTDGGTCVLCVTRAAPEFEVTGVMGSPILNP